MVDWASREPLRGCGAFSPLGSARVSDGTRMQTLGEAVITAQQRLGWLPDWMLSVLILAVFAAMALLLHGVGVAIVRRSLRRRDEFWRSLVQGTRGPSRLALLVVGLGIAAHLAPLGPILATWLKQGLMIAFILLLGWIVLAALDIASAIHLRKFKIDVEDNLLARKHVTQTRILRRAAAAMIVILTLAFALMTIPGVKQYGVSLLASAGVAGIIPWWPATSGFASTPASPCGRATTIISARCASSTSCPVSSTRRGSRIFRTSRPSSWTSWS